MIARYPALYRDAHGEEATLIENDGKTLRMVVRGVEFTGRMFDDFEPSIAQDDPALVPFSLYCGSLCSYVIECDIPLPVAFGDETLDGRLHVRLDLGNPRQGTTGPVIGGIDRVDLLLTLTTAGQSLRSCGKHGWFENELDEIQHALPPGIFMKNCLNCAFSDYSPYGNGLFGCLACFRDNKEAYRSVHTKADIFRMWDTMTEFVQETYLCPEFQRRAPNSGYRG
jgi:Family of unknown function (DUF6304)